MKRMKLAALALSLVGVFSAGNALAADSTEVTVNASVTEACIASTSTTITIAAIDPTTATDTVNGTPGSINVMCTEGTLVNFSAPATAVLTGGVSSDTMEINTILPTITAGNNDKPGIGGMDYAVNASIDFDQYSTATAGSYTGKFTVTVTP